MAKKVKIKKTLVEQILTKAGIDHTGIQINALEGELPPEYDRNQIGTIRGQNGANYRNRSHNRTPR